MLPDFHNRGFCSRLVFVQSGSQAGISAAFASPPAALLNVESYRSLRIRVNHERYLNAKIVLKLDCEVRTVSARDV